MLYSIYTQIKKYVALVDIGFGHSLLPVHSAGRRLLGSCEKFWGVSLQILLKTNNFHLNFSSFKTAPSTQAEIYFNETAVDISVPPPNPFTSSKSPTFVTKYQNSRAKKRLPIKCTARQYLCDFM